MRLTPATCKNWALDELDKAYAAGFAAALRGQDPHRQPEYANDVLAAGWHAGWEDGHSTLRRYQQNRQEADSGALLMTMRLELPGEGVSPPRKSLASPDYTT